jgi:D-arabinose 1-dehydrogenase-like Zn-dependent alcohol dehydrogenase
MKAMVLEGVEDYNLREVPKPVCAPHGVLLKVMANGVCRSDWHKWHGHYSRKYPMILGHEMCGYIEEVGELVTRFKAGDRVMVPVSGSDGTCDMCIAGHGNLCDSYLVPGIGYNGGFAEYVAVPYADRNLEYLPDNVTFEEGAILSCRFITGFNGISEIAKVQIGEWVAIYGCGGVGLAAVETASKMGAFVIAVDVKDEALDLAKEMGADYVINSSKTDPVEKIKEITGGKGVDVAAEALGNKEVFTQCFNSLALLGRLVQLGVTQLGPEGSADLPVNPLVQGEYQILGSLSAPVQRFKPLLELVAAGKIDVKPLLRETCCLSEVEDVFRRMDTGDVVGAVVCNDFTR